MGGEEKQRYMKSRLSIGGLKYVVDTRPWMERLFWIIFIFVGTLVVTFMLYQTIHDWEVNPVVQSLNDDFPTKKVTKAHY